MIKIWAKIIKENKIIKSYTLTLEEQMDYSKFFDYTLSICNHLDMPTPVILKTHIFNYAKFNFVRFTPEDFVEKVDFDKFILENVNR